MPKGFDTKDLQEEKALLDELTDQRRPYCRGKVMSQTQKPIRLFGCAQGRLERRKNFPFNKESPPLTMPTAALRVLRGSMRQSDWAMLLSLSR
jgi:hypothetical protein